AHVDARPLEHQPARLKPEAARRHAAELEPHHHARRRQVSDVDAAVHGPHQERGIEIAGRELTGGMAPPPLAHALDHLAEPRAGGGELVLAPAAGPERGALDHPRLLQLMEALREERAGDQRHPAADLVEAARTGEQLAKDQRSPPLGEDLGRDGDRAELPVALHAPTLVSRPHRGKSIFWSCWAPGRLALSPQGGEPWRPAKSSRS